MRSEMHLKVFALAMTALVPCFAANWDPSAPPRYTPAMVGAEAGGSLVGAIAGGAAIGLGTWLVADAVLQDTVDGTTPGQAALVAGWIAYPVGAAAGATLAGSLVKDDGWFVPSVFWAGATAALAAGMYFGSVALNDTSSGRKASPGAANVLWAASLVVEALGVPAAACIGYTKGRPAIEGLGRRVLPGSFAFRGLPDRSLELRFEPVLVKF
jgi:hypothetical protein